MSTQQQDDLHQEITQLPPYASQWFSRLVSLFIENTANPSMRQSVYTDWVNTYFRTAKEKQQCVFCNNATHTTQEEEPTPFCSKQCEQDWKRILWKVLRAYMDV